MIPKEKQDDVPPFNPPSSTSKLPPIVTLVCFSPFFFFVLLNSFPSQADEILILFSLRPRDRIHRHIKAIFELGFNTFDVSNLDGNAVLGVVSRAPHAKIIFLCHGGGTLMVQFGKITIDLQGDNALGFIEKLGEATNYGKDILFLTCHAGQLSGINWRQNSAALKKRLYHIRTDFSLSFQNARQILEEVARSRTFQHARNVDDVDGTTFYNMVMRKEKMERGLLEKPNAEDQALEESFHDVSVEEWK